MAERILFRCDHCGAEIEAWSDGNPYYIDSAGTKQYAYHPNHDLLQLCIGNDEPHLCLDCGAEFMVDSNAPSGRCPRCGSSSIADSFTLEGLTCPRCKRGKFAQDPGSHAVS